MSADEMFEELKYKKHDNHIEEVRRLYYEQKGTTQNGWEGIEHIEFDLIKKNIVCWAKLNGKATIVPLNIKEL